MNDTGRTAGGILRVLRGVRLPCGCVAGLYETYAGATIVVIDDVHRDCRTNRHRKDLVVDSERAAAHTGNA